jgi:hypothetical protein
VGRCSLWCVTPGADTGITASEQGTYSMMHEGCQNHFSANRHNHSMNLPARKVCCIYICMNIFNFTDTEGRDSVSVMNPIYAYGHEFSRHLAQGLADNWSQVSKHYSFITRAEYDKYCVYHFTYISNIDIIMK